MNIHKAIEKLVDYALSKGLIKHYDVVWATNMLFGDLGIDGWEPEINQQVESSHIEYDARDLNEILEVILDNGVDRGLISDDIVSRDLLSAKIMGTFTPWPSSVIEAFWNRYDASPEEATDWFYNLNISNNYIQAYRVSKDVKWKTRTEYGELDITINLSKPEKDPKAIAAAAKATSSDYPQCLLCRSNEGYAGRANHPPRQNLRLIPLVLDGQRWFFQYSPYSYFNEHCIVLSEHHVPMQIDKSTFVKLIDFVKMFPHYTIGSNADLPIVGGSILSHDHFQGGRYEFPLLKAESDVEFEFDGFRDVEASILKWPMSVICLRSTDAEQIIGLSSKILDTWRAYSDEKAFIFAKTDGQLHNTITPIARMHEGKYEMYLVLRNNITTPEHPLGVFHPHADLHHIKKENIGLIEVMGLAILPARLKKELQELTDAIIENSDISAMDSISKHAQWVDQLKSRHNFTRDNVEFIIKDEVGLVFEKVLEDAGVFKRNSSGKEGFLRFVDTVNKL